jgi:hypothetical protein
MKIDASLTFGNKNAPTNTKRQIKKTQPIHKQIQPAAAGGIIVARPRKGRKDNGAKRPPLAAPLPRAFDLRVAPILAALDTSSAI